MNSPMRIRKTSPNSEDQGTSESGVPGYSAAGTSVKQMELMQYRWSVGVG